MTIHTALTVRPRRALFLEAADILRHAITQGEYPPDQLLPCEQELAARHGVSRTVLRQALVQLVRENLVSIRQGLGATPRAPATDTLTRGSGDAFNGLAPAGPPADSRTTADPRTASLLAIALDHPVCQRDQLATLTTTGRRVFVRTVLPHRAAAHLGLDPDTVPKRPALLALMHERFGPLAATDVTRVTTATARQAVLLELPEPAILLETTRVTRAARGGALLADIQHTAAYGIDLVSRLCQAPLDG